MHDWTLNNIDIAWKAGTAVIKMKSARGAEFLSALGIRHLQIPHAYPWGPSVSVNRVDGPTIRDDGLAELTIEMQSGDRIEIVAESFSMPEISN